MSKPRSIKQFKEELDKLDMTPTQWALKHGFNPAAVHRVLRGEGRCLWGEPRRIARAANLPITPQRRAA